MKKSTNGPSTGKCPFHFGSGAELHQTSDKKENNLTTNQGVVISDNQNSLKSFSRGPTLLEDFVLREKITHFDHERIPERIVHARGSGAHGVFEAYKSFSELTSASFLAEAGKKTEVFVRFSTVAGGAGSGDLPRDVRGFAVKFYTDQGNFDLVGNNIPVFFIQDALKFPDLIHSVKMEADRGYPQAASAHDTFWDFASLMPESTHMLMWAMSDRAIPRSLRMIEGFGIHTFRFINAKGKSTFVKFHWRPLLGMSSVLWDEAVKINGADPDFHRRDLYDAIANGNFPEWEFCVQAFDQKTADKFEFDVLDSTKLIPEELVPLTRLGKMTLNRNPDNFFAETEQVAFHPGHIVPGIDFTNDPLLQGRLFSYTDTQLSRLGGPNFHQIPVNRARCPVMNFQRDAIMQMEVPKGRANYEPNSISECPRENPSAGFRSYQLDESGEKGRIRSESFADHFSQARLFFESMTEPEKEHIINAFAFELSKVSLEKIRTRMLGNLSVVSKELCSKVEDAMGMKGRADKVKPLKAPLTLKPSPSLSILNKAVETLKGRKVGILATDKSDLALIDKIKKAIKKEGGSSEIVAPRIAGNIAANGEVFPADHTISGGPSFFFDAIIVVTGEGQAEKLASDPSAVEWVSNAYNHLKTIGSNKTAAPLMEAAKVKKDRGIVTLEQGSDIPNFIETARKGRIWDRK